MLNCIRTNFWLLAGQAVTAAPTQIPDPESASVEDVAEALQSTATGEEKTNFLIEYLLAQRSGILDFLKTILFALFIYFIGKKLVKFFLKLTDKWLTKRGTETGVQHFIMSFASILYHLILIFIVAWILGIGATIVAIVSSAGLAIGLALQGSLSNLAGGVLILILKPFKVGEYISVSGVEGTVESIDIFYTHVVTTENKTIVIPNGVITNETITNVTSVTKRMLIIDFSIPYEMKTEAVRKILLEEMQAEERIFQKEEKAVVINKLTPVNVQMQCKAWVATKDYWAVRYNLLEKIKLLLEEQQKDLLQK